jgi:hypothetical protein
MVNAQPRQNHTEIPAEFSGDNRESKDFENFLSYHNHYTVSIDAKEHLGLPYSNTLKREVRNWLYENIGDNRTAVWEYVGLLGEKAVFVFLRQEDAALFRLFYG